MKAKKRYMKRSGIITLSGLGMTVVERLLFDQISEFLSRSGAEAMCVLL